MYYCFAGLSLSQTCAVSAAAQPHIRQQATLVWTNSRYNACLQELKTDKLLC